MAKMPRCRSCAKGMEPHCKPWRCLWLVCEACHVLYSPRHDKWIAWRSRDVAVPPEAG